MPIANTLIPKLTREDIAAIFGPNMRAVRAYEALQNGLSNDVIDAINAAQADADAAQASADAAQLSADAAQADADAANAGVAAADVRIDALEIAVDVLELSVVTKAKGRFIYG